MPKPRLAQTVATYVPDFTEKSVWPRTGVPPPGSQRLAPEGTRSTSVDGTNIPTAPMPSVPGRAAGSSEGCRGGRV